MNRSRGKEVVEVCTNVGGGVLMLDISPAGHHDVPEANRLWNDPRVRAGILGPL